MTSVLLLFSVVQHVKNAGILLKLSLDCIIIGPNWNRSVSEKMSKRAEMPFLKVNGKSENIGGEIDEKEC